MAEYVRRERALCEGAAREVSRRARRRSSYRTIDVAQLRAGGDDRAHDVGGGHATSESRRSPLRTRRRKAMRAAAAITSHLWAVTGVTVKLATG